MCKISGFLSHLCWCITRCWWLSWDEAWLIEQSQHQHFWLLSTTILHARYYWYLSNVLSTVLSLKEPSEIRILATHHLSKVMILMCCSRLPLDSPVTASPEISRNSSSSSNKRLQFETFPEGSRNDFSARCLRIMTHSSSWWSESCNLRSLGLQQRKKLERLTAWKIYTHFIYTYICILETYFKHLQTTPGHLPPPKLVSCVNKKQELCQFSSWLGCNSWTLRLTRDRATIWLVMTFMCTIAYLIG